MTREEALAAIPEEMKSPEYWADAKTLYGALLNLDAKFANEILDEALRSGGTQSRLSIDVDANAFARLLLCLQAMAHFGGILIDPTTPVRSLNGAPPFPHAPPSPPRPLDTVSGRRLPRRGRRGHW